MRMPSAAQRRSLDKAASLYQQNVNLAASFLSGRGIGPEATEARRLGVVLSPEPGHEHVVGRLSIPYLNRAGVVGFAFRCIQDHQCKAEGHEKYMSPYGQETLLFDAMSTDAGWSRRAHICEGELDAIVLATVFPDEPVCGVPGASKWQPHWKFHFQGFDRVLAWPDGDKAGRDLANKIRKEVEAAEIVSLPSGHDVGSLYLEAGPQALLALTGDNEEPELTHA